MEVKHAVTLKWVINTILKNWFVAAVVTWPVHKCVQSMGLIFLNTSADIVVRLQFSFALEQHISVILAMTIFNV